MQKRNDCNTVQISQGEITESNSRGFEENKRLIELAQGEDGELSSAACEELVIKNRGLVHSIAVRFRERGIEFEDLMQIGTIGLLKAIKSFDLQRGTCFSTYAVPMIFGEIRRAFRDEGPIKVGRYYKKLGAELMKAKNRIMLGEGREPRIRELAEAVGVSAEEAAIALDSMLPVSSLSDLVYGEDDGAVLEDILADTESIDATQRMFEKIALREAIRKMPEDWQKILALRYFRNKTQQQVADVMGLSQVKVSREEKKIVAFLKKELGAPSK